MSENIGEWRARKWKQLAYVCERYPFLSIEAWQDFETKFVLICDKAGEALIIGQLPCDGIGSVDASNEDIDKWIEGLDIEACQSPA